MTTAVDTAKELDPQQRFERVMGSLRKRIGDGPFELWLGSIRLDALELNELPCRVRLSVATLFLANWVRDHYKTELQALWEAELEGDVVLQIVARGALKTEPRIPDPEDRPRVVPAPEIPVKETPLSPEEEAMDALAKARRFPIEGTAIAHVAFVIAHHYTELHNSPEVLREAKRVATYIAWIKSTASLDHIRSAFESGSMMETAWGISYTNKIRAESPEVNEIIESLLGHLENLVTEQPLLEFEVAFRMKRKTTPTTDDIQKVVCTHYGISKVDMVSERKTREVILPRQIAIYLAKAMTGRSLPEVGRRFGGRDHTTVLHAVKKIQKMVEENPEFAAKVRKIQGQLSFFARNELPRADT